MKGDISLLLYQKKQVKSINLLLYISWIIMKSGLDPSAGCTKKSQWGFVENPTLTFLSEQGCCSTNELVNNKVYVTSVTIRIILRLLILF